MQLTWILFAVSILAACVHLTLTTFLYNSIISAMKTDGNRMAVTFERVMISKYGPYRGPEDDNNISKK